MEQDIKKIHPEVMKSMRACKKEHVKIVEKYLNIKKQADNHKKELAGTSRHREDTTKS